MTRARVVAAVAILAAALALILAPRIGAFLAQDACLDGGGSGQDGACRH